MEACIPFAQGTATPGCHGNSQWMCPKARAKAGNSPSWLPWELSNTRPALALSSGGAGLGEPVHAPQTQDSWGAGLYQVGEGGNLSTYLRYQGGARVGGGNGRTKGRREGVVGVVKGLRLGPLEGRGEEGAARRGRSWGPSRAGPRVCTIWFAIKLRTFQLGPQSSCVCLWCREKWGAGGP